MSDNDFVLPLTEVEVPPDSVILPEDTFDAMSIGEKLQRETTVFEIHIRRPGFSKPIPPAEFIRKIKAAGEANLTPEQELQLQQYRATFTETVGPNGEQTDASMLRVSQDILARSEISKIVNHDDKFSAWIKNQSIPSPYLAAGLYQIFRYRVKEIDTAVIQFVKQRRKIIKELGQKYQELKEQAAKRRWPFYDEADYPSWEIIEAKYRVEARYVTYNVDAAIQDINKEIFEREEKKIKLQWASAAEEAQQVQRRLAQDLLESCATMLGRDENGKRKTFRPKAMEKMKEFLEIFDQMNFTNDQQLKVIMNEIQQVMSGIDVDSLKKDVALRDTFETAFSKIKTDMEGMVITRERKVVFDDFEVDDDEEVIDGDALPLA